MIGDNPVVIVLVVLALGLFAYTRLLRRRDPRRCPQCQRHVLDVRATGPDVVCPHCATELRRAEDGSLQRR